MARMRPVAWGREQARQLWDRGRDQSNRVQFNI